MNFDPSLLRLTETQITALRQSINNALAANARALNDIVLSEFVRSLRTEGAVSVDQIQSLVEELFSIPASESRKLSALVEKSQAELFKARETLTGLKSTGSYEQLISTFRVNFPAIENRSRILVVNKFRRIIDGGGNIDDVRRALEGNNVVAYQAKTLSQTAVAQADNEYGILTAVQGGIEWFTYDGTTPQRSFCVEHYRKDYTLEQLEKMNNGQGLPVRSALGGYNCTHFLNPNPFKTKPAAIDPAKNL